MEFVDFFKMTAVCYIGFVVRIDFWTTHEEHLVVFITVQNLIGIDVVVSMVSIISKLYYFVCQA